MTIFLIFVLLPHYCFFIIRRVFWSLPLQVSVILSASKGIINSLGGFNSGPLKVPFHNSLQKVTVKLRSWLLKAM